MFRLSRKRTLHKRGNRLCKRNDGITHTELNAVASIVADSKNGVDSSPSLTGLTKAGITGLTESQASYRQAIANASPEPSSLESLQAIIDALNTEAAAVSSLLPANIPVTAGPSAFIVSIYDTDKMPYTPPTVATTRAVNKQVVPQILG